MKVLHVITGLDDGGAEAVLFRLCATDHAVQHHVVSLMGLGKYATPLIDAGVPVQSLHMNRGKPSLAAALRLSRIVRGIKPDVVQTWMYHANLIGGLAARLAGNNAVFWGIHHSELTPTATSRSTRLVSRALAALSSWLPKGIVYCAERAQATHEANQYSAKKGFVIPNGYDLTKFFPSEEMRTAIREELHLLSNEPLIGIVARWHPDKNHRLLLRALEDLAIRGLEFKCILVGHGMDSSNDELTALLAEHNLQDICLLLSRRSDVNAIMNAIDIHVLSSTTEAFPNVLAEAMACATPCVSTDVGDAALITGDTGWITPPGDASSLSAALSAAITELGTVGFSARRNAARRRVEDHFSIQRMIDSYHAVWSF